MNLTDFHDQYVERHWLDEPEPQCPKCDEPADRCGCESCLLCGWQPTDCECVKCDNCGRSMPRATDDGICLTCSIRWLASHQLGQSNGQKPLSRSATDVRVPAVAEQPLSLDQVESCCDWIDHVLHPTLDPSSLFYESTEARQRQTQWHEKQARLWSDSQPIPEEFK